MPDLIFKPAASQDPYALTYPLAAGESVIVYARNLVTLRVKPGAGATVTVSEVDGPTATVHGTTDLTTDATSAVGALVAWPYILVTVTGGSCVIGGT